MNKLKKEKMINPRNENLIKENTKQQLKYLNKRRKREN